MLECATALAAPRVEPFQVLFDLDRIHKRGCGLDGEDRSWTKDCKPAEQDRGTKMKFSKFAGDRSWRFIV